MTLLEDNCATAAAGYWIFHHDGDRLGSIDNARTILSQKGVELGCSVIFGSVDGKGGTDSTTVHSYPRVCVCECIRIDSIDIS
jgi:hypothetical protein